MKAYPSALFAFSFASATHLSTAAVACLEAFCIASMTVPAFEGLDIALLGGKQPFGIE